MKKSLYLTLAAAIAALGLQPVLAHTGRHLHAQTGPDRPVRSETASENPPTNKPANAPETVEIQIQNAQSRGREARQSARRRACEQQSAAVTRIMGNLVDLGERQLALFDTISKRVQDFYAERELSASGYTQAVAAVEAARAKVVTQLDAMRQTESSFDCAASSPGSIVSSFRDDLKALIGALKTYRSETRNLIITVKQSTDEAARADNAATADDTASGNANSNATTDQGVVDAE